MSQAVIALVGTVFGGAGFKIIEHYLGRAKRKIDENKSLWDEIDEARRDANSWRNKYYALVSYISAGDLEGARRLIKRGK